MNIVRSILKVACLCLVWLLPVFPSMAQPDLQIADLNTASVITDGQSLAVGGSIGFSIANAGSTAVIEPFSVIAFEDRNSNGLYDSGTDLVLGTLDESASIAAGVSLPRSIALSGTVLFKGNLIYIFADSGNAIAESNETNNISNTGSLSFYTPPVISGPLTPIQEWHWTPPAGDSFPTSWNVMMAPVVMDLDGDGIPEVIFGSTASTGGSYVEVGVLRAVRGTDGSPVFTVSDAAYAINTASSIAAGDIDDDGRPEIIACDSTGARLIAFEHNGAFKWRSPTLEAVYWGAPAIADIDKDGTPEIIIGRQVLNNDGSIRWTGNGGRGSQSSIGPLSLVADVDLDGSPEIVAGNTIYRANGTIYAQNTGLPDGFNAVGNFDDDANPEIVLISGGYIRLLEHNLAAKWGPVLIPGGGIGGAPTIADYDGDGQPEIGAAGASRYAVFETNGTLKWAAVTQDGSSNCTGSSVFDFDGDGSSEVVYRDELFLRVYRGTDGFVLFSTPMSSCTWYEYVLVADVDADGKAELVAVANTNCGYGPQNGVYVFGDMNNGWVATRKVWNQHTYHITNVNQDGTIPTDELNNWQQAGLNNYRLNTFAPNEPQPESLPDLVPSYLRFDLANCPASVIITARIGNGGSLFAPAGVNISFYSGDPAVGGVLLGTVQTSVPLNPGEYEDVVFIWAPPITGTQDIYVRADDDGAGAGVIQEGFEDNNVHNANVTICLKKCDIDADGDIDQYDLALISKARGQKATGPNDPRDSDNNGLITPNDVKVCIPKCTRANCRVQ
ncbi:MAG: VCBS repeat-containing protein [Acidobacteria bacterium]|nr:VCBS repeat-containing protein [Acidobacteriota bacterium]